MEKRLRHVLAVHDHDVHRRVTNCVISSLDGQPPIGYGLLDLDHPEGNQRQLGLMLTSKDYLVTVFVSPRASDRKAPEWETLSLLLGYDKSIAPRGIVIDSDDRSVWQRLSNLSKIHPYDFVLNVSQEPRNDWADFFPELTSPQRRHEGRALDTRFADLASHLNALARRERVRIAA